MKLYDVDKNNGIMICFFYHRTMIMLIDLSACSCIDDLFVDMNQNLQVVNKRTHEITINYNKLAIAKFQRLESFLSLCAKQKCVVFNLFASHLSSLFYIRVKISSVLNLNKLLDRYSIVHVCFVNFFFDIQHLKFSNTFIRLFYIFRHV